MSSVNQSLTSEMEELARMAAEVDFEASSLPDEKPKRVKRPGAKTVPNKEETAEVREVEVIPSDPEFDMMLTSLIGDGVDMCKKHAGFTEPGQAWRIKVGALSARICQRYMQPGAEYRDIGFLVAFLGMWVGTNLKMLADDKQAERNISPRT